MTSFQLRADREVCIGSGLCAFAEPSIFEQDDADGQVRLTTNYPEAPLHESVRNAVDNCPVQALTFRKATS
ncbi:ferredoxin [Nocardia sp. NPDC051570]|uniref:ferredoxin n=1 Tax=Nocardia sp. NPDC051570 TaxID=3364324 RepID=UPI0037A96FB7